MSSFSFSRGVWNPSVLRGRSLSWSTKASIASSGMLLKLVPSGEAHHLVREDVHHGGRDAGAGKSSYQREACVAFHERDDPRVFGSGYEIISPMLRDSTITGGSGPIREPGPRQPRSDITGWQL